MADTDGLISAFLLDGEGGGRAIEWDEVRSWTAERGMLWVHLDRTESAAQQWLQSQAALDPLMSEALLAEETRPRSLLVGDALLVILRGVNLNPGAEPEDMVSLRMWVDSKRIITLRSRHLMAIEDLRAGILAGNGPKDPGDFLATVSGRLIERMSPIIDTLDDEIDALEEAVLEGETHEVRGRLANLRRRTITLRRYIAPQREAMSRLYGEQLPWFSPADRARLREVTDRITRYVEDLDAARERAAVTQEELSNRISAQMNRTMYVLSLVAGIFLPLGLITGLLGINVGGIPGGENKLAFYIVTFLLVGLAVLLVWIFRRMKWL
jgi:zinc transporter